MTVVSFDDFLDNGKPQTGTGRQVMSLGRPVESLKNAFAISWRDHQAFAPHLQDHRPSLRLTKVMSMGDPGSEYLIALSTN